MKSRTGQVKILKSPLNIAKEKSAKYSALLDRFETFDRWNQEACRNFTGSFRESDLPGKAHECFKLYTEIHLFRKDVQKDDNFTKAQKNKLSKILFSLLIWLGQLGLVDPEVARKERKSAEHYFNNALELLKLQQKYLFEEEDASFYANICQMQFFTDRNYKVNNTQYLFAYASQVSKDSLINSYRLRLHLLCYEIESNRSVSNTKLLEKILESYRKMVQEISKDSKFSEGPEYAYVFLGDFEFHTLLYFKNAKESELDLQNAIYQRLIPALEHLNKNFSQQAGFCMEIICRIFDQLEKVFKVMEKSLDVFPDKDPILKDLNVIVEKMNQLFVVAARIVPEFEKTRFFKINAQDRKICQEKIKLWDQGKMPVLEKQAEAEIHQQAVENNYQAFINTLEKEAAEKKAVEDKRRAVEFRERPQMLWGESLLLPEGVSETQDEQEQKKTTQKKLLHQAYQENLANNFSSAMQLCKQAKSLAASINDAEAILNATDIMAGIAEKRQHQQLAYLENFMDSTRRKRMPDSEDLKIFADFIDNTKANEDISVIYEAYERYLESSTREKGNLNIILSANSIAHSISVIDRRMQNLKTAIIGFEEARVWQREYFRSLHKENKRGCGLLRMEEKPELAILRENCKDSCYILTKTGEIFYFNRWKPAQNPELKGTLESLENQHFLHLDALFPQNMAILSSDKLDVFIKLCNHKRNVFIENPEKTEKKINYSEISIQCSLGLREYQNYYEKIREKSRKNIAATLGNCAFVALPQSLEETFIFLRQILGKEGSIYLVGSTPGRLYRKEMAIYKRDLDFVYFGDFDPEILKAAGFIPCKRDGLWKSMRHIPEYGNIKLELTLVKNGPNALINDARQRDFTFSSLYCDITGLISNPLRHSGFQDLLEQRIVLLGEDPQKRLQENPVLILRIMDQCLQGKAMDEALKVLLAQWKKDPEFWNSAVMHANIHKYMEYWPEVYLKQLKSNAVPQDFLASMFAIDPEEVWERSLVKLDRILAQTREGAQPLHTGRLFTRSGIGESDPMQADRGFHPD